MNHFWHSQMSLSDIQTVVAVNYIDQNFECHFLTLKCQFFNTVSAMIWYLQYLFLWHSDISLFLTYFTPFYETTDTLKLQISFLDTICRLSWYQERHVMNLSLPRTLDALKWEVWGWLMTHEVSLADFWILKLNFTQLLILRMSLFDTAGIIFNTLTSQASSDILNSKYKTRTLITYWHLEWYSTRHFLILKCHHSTSQSFSDSLSSHGAFSTFFCQKWE